MRVLLLGLMLVAGCSSAEIPDGVFRCTGDADCPPGLTCRAAEGLCFREGGGGRMDSGLPPRDGGACSSDPECDDGIECTLDRCTGGSCTFDPSSCPPGCNDEVCRGSAGPCQTAMCVEGECRRSSTCKAGEECCAGSCAPIGCNDGVDCTNDRCGAAGCEHTTDVSRCTAGPDPSCDSILGCQYSMCTPATCVAGPCETAICAGPTCMRTPMCSPTQMCCGSSCVPLGCDDGNPCTDGACVSGTCQQTHNTLACDDGSLCTTGDRCVAGMCRGTPMVCDPDLNVCDFEVCDPATGLCGHTPAAHACEDGDRCTVGDSCGGGFCQRGEDVFCPDDGDPCTTDACDPGTGACGIYRGDGAGCGGARFVCCARACRDLNNCCSDPDGCRGAAGCYNSECHATGHCESCP